MRNVNTSLAIMLAALLTFAPLGFPEAESSAEVFCDGIVFVDGIDECVPRPGAENQQSTNNGGSNNG